MRKMEKINILAKDERHWGADKGKLREEIEMRKRCLKHWKGEELQTRLDCEIDRDQCGVKGKNRKKEQKIQPVKKL